MIKAILVFNNHGKPRLLKFYTRYVSARCIGHTHTPAALGDACACMSRACVSWPALRHATCSQRRTSNTSCARHFSLYQSGKPPLDVLARANAEQPARTEELSKRLQRRKCLQLSRGRHANRRRRLQADLPPLRDALFRLLRGLFGERARHSRPYTSIRGDARPLLRERVRAGPHLSR